MQLRDYQQAAVDGLFNWWNDNREGNPLIVVPTAGGKTVIFSAIIKKLMEEYTGCSILILAHRKELISQAEQKLLSVWPTAPVGVYAASLDRREIAPITIASRDSIANKIKDIGRFELVFVDEAHNIAPGETTRYRKIIEGLRENYPDLHVIGFTATPYRGDGKLIYGEKNSIFAGIAYEIHIQELLKKEFLSPVTAISVAQESIADTSEVKTTGGDFNLKELEAVTADEELIKAAMTEWETKAYNRGRESTVFFCVSVLHANLVSEELAKRGYTVPVISGETPKQLRDDILKKFHRGDLIGIANCAILTEGTDIPRIDCISLLRPTKSIVLYKQIIGRGMRLSPETGKQNCLILDHGGCIERFGPVDIAQPAAKRKKKDDRTKVCPKCKTINGIFKRKCVKCEFQFEPNPVKICESCEEENHPSAAECIACGAPFFNHSKTATEGGILSSEPNLQTFEVEEISCQTMVSRKSGKPYLKVIYRVSLFELFFKNLMIGHDGYAGKKAKQEWTAIARGTNLPRTPEECMRQIANEEAYFRPVESITVDMNTKYKDIVKIEYKTKEAA